MLMNLFSPFNPSSSFLNINWMSFFILILLLPLSWKIMSTKFSMLTKYLIKMMTKEIKPLLQNDSTASQMIFISMFMLIMIINSIGLFPYIFTPTSHISMSLSLSFPIWLAMMIYGWTQSTKLMFIHLVPQNTPNMLMPFMVLIETISLVIRPITLSVRLTANMIAGHLLITLLNSLLQNLQSNSLPIMMIPELMLISLESAVAIIQAYVFMILITLYSTEIY